MAPYSSTLAWKIQWMEEPGRLQSMGSLRVGHDWATSLSLFTFMHWRRKWQPTPVFLHEGFPGDSVVKNPPAMQETQVRSLGWEDPLEEGIATHSSILAWRTPRTEKPVGLQYMGSQSVGYNWSDWACMHNICDDWVVCGKAVYLEANKEKY